MMAGLLLLGGLEILLFVITHGIPIYLTWYNIRRLRNLDDDDKEWSIFIDLFIFLLGPTLMWILYFIWSPDHWDQRVTINSFLEFSYHEPISRDYSLTFSVLCITAWCGFMILRFAGKKLPPLLKVLCMGTVYLGCFLSVAFIVQMLPNMFESYFFLPTEGILMCLFPLNYIFSSVAAFNNIIRSEEKLESEQEKKGLARIGKILRDSKKWPVLGLIAFIPILGICIMCLLLFGQQPADAVIKMFTETSDWTFSQMVSPQPYPSYGDHYLCTVAAGGHKRLVKPKRLGKRRGHTIIVNRQLCIANAFEEVIAEKTPRFHRNLRHFYDTYGYPVAKHITNPWRADLVYLLMKPLEWFFLIVLYMVDVKPEERISRQYL